MALGDTRRLSGDTFAATRSPVITWPSGMATNDVALLVMASDTSHDTTGTPPTGWTKGLAGDAGELDRTTDTTLSWFWYRSASGGESGTTTWTNIFAATESGRAVMIAWPGALTSGDPFSASGSETSTSGTAKDTAAVTPAHADTLAIGVLACDPGNNPATFTWDGGITELIDSDTTPSGQDALNAYIAVGQKLLSGTPNTSLGGDLAAGEAMVELIAFLRAAGATAYTLSADPGVYTLTGVAATTVADRVVTADSGSYAVSGTAAAPVAGRIVSANPGSYALTGSSATPVADRLLSAVPGSYALTGTAASVVAGRLVSADPGSYTLTGVAASLVYATAGAYSLDLAAGSYTLTGVAATLAGSAAPGFLEASFGASTGLEAAFGSAAELEAAFGQVGGFE